MCGHEPTKLERKVENLYKILAASVNRRSASVTAATDKTASNAQSTALHLEKLRTLRRKLASGRRRRNAELLHHPAVHIFEHLGGELITFRIEPQGERCAG